MKTLWLLALPVTLIACREAPIAPDNSPDYAVSTAGGQNKLLCFTSGAATCTANSSGTKGSATLSITGPSGTGAAAVYYSGFNTSFYGVALPDIKALSYQFAGTALLAGSPRFSVPIDQNGDGLTDAFAFIPAATCNNGQGKEDVIADASCLVYYAPDGVTGWPNWAAFAAAHPTYAVALLDNYAFVIGDDPGTWTISQVVVGKTGK